MAIAEYHPSALMKRNRGLLRMPKAKLREFASTSRSGLPKMKKKGTSQVGDMMDEK